MSEPSANAAHRLAIVGTAGHIDHGKTALVRRLTGVDTDRLPEEKKRGISIDLGFAPLVTPAGVTSGAKPRSMLMPRFFSSGNRSVSTPVSRRTSAVLPWSIWPAVPTIARRCAALALGSDMGWAF